MTRGSWEQMVAGTVDLLDAGTMQKVVLARSQRLALASEVDTGTVLSRLAEHYPQCFVFSFKDSGATWLGASPELLCRVQDGLVEAESLAGSRPRGDSPEDDRRLAKELAASRKERAEHEMVAGAIAEILAEICSEVTVPDRFRVMRMPNIQHLFTPICGRLAAGLDILDVAARLHPTPAVAGCPRGAAIDTIDRLEDMDRGWYAGPIGWVDFDGDGEFAVALRSALVGGREARLYAGGGIVSGSVPPQEYAETETKFKPIREALGLG